MVRAAARRGRIEMVHELKLCGYTLRIAGYELLLLNQVDSL